MIFCILLFVSCEDYSNQEINQLLRSDDPEKIIKALYLIGEKRDTTFLQEIIDNPYDPRVSHDLRFKGISVYQSKMIALKKISGTLPPREITYQPDSVIVKFYCKWVNEKLR